MTYSLRRTPIGAVGEWGILVLDFHYSHGPNFLLRTRRSMREPRPQQSVQPRPNQRAANGHDHHGDAIAYQREEWSRTSTRKRPAQAEDRAPNCVANAALQFLGRNPEANTEKNIGQQGDPGPALRLTGSFLIFG